MWDAACAPATGFLPTRAEWTIGLRHYLYFAAVGLPLALALKAVHFAAPAPLWKIAATFLGFFWVIALSEEFLVRGVLQGWIEEWTERHRGSAGHLGSVRRGAPVLPRLPQLAMGADCDNPGLVLRPRAQPIGGHSCGSGDARTGGHYLASFLRVKSGA